MVIIVLHNINYSLLNDQSLFKLGFNLFSLIGYGNNKLASVNGAI